MEEFPSNARRPRNLPQEPKKVEKVVVGEVIMRKKPVGRRVLDTLFGGDPHGVLGFVMMEVIVPAVRAVVVDAFQSGVERMVYGETQSPSRRGPFRSTTGPSSSYVRYDRYSSAQQPNRFTREEPREPYRRPRPSHDTDEMLFQTYAEAQEVLTRMWDLLAEYEQVTVSDLMSMVDITGNYTDETRGWTDLRGSKVVKVRGGYILDLPPKESLKP